MLAFWDRYVGRWQQTRAKMQQKSSIPRQAYRNVVATHVKMH